MVIIMTLWIGNDAVLKSSSQWQLKEVLKLNNSVHESFIFKILLSMISHKDFCGICRRQYHYEFNIVS